ncbi:MAG: response regulator transcription factor [Candidatus Eremiobacteraeota bacterium]|nr:response regulator transcription factor [Candidatus Eremiobacteraeota bacterium]MBC5826076.1 response regulator transcription factor [Candidatus Eremiobacteraeota bacterium]
MRILVVEDDTHLRLLLERIFLEAGYDVEAAQDGTAADALAARGGFDALVLDWMLPGMDGSEICRRLRDANDATPVILFTAKDAVHDRVAGLDVGADDYIVKPFHVDELLARVRTVIRRAGTQRRALYKAGALQLDVGARTAKVGEDDVDLTAREFGLLEYLVRNTGLGLSRAQIEEHVWGSQFVSSSNVVDVFVRRLRRKLGSFGRKGIETLRGYGYRLKN